MLHRLLIAFLIAGSLVIARAAAPARLAGDLDAMLRATSLRKAKIGISIQSLNDGAFWYDHNGDDMFIPASVAKLATTTLALEYLKPEYTFVTRVLTDGKIVDGVLQGDLYLQGSGDPSLLPEDLAALAGQLAAGNADNGIPAITKVEGRLLLDDTFFPGPGPLLGAGWEQEDLPWYYAAPAGALSCHRNAVTITVHGAGAGEPAQVTVEPPTELFTIDNRAVTSTAVRKGSVDVAPAGYRVRITGKIAPDAEITERISVPDPTQFFAEQFMCALHAAGIAIEGVDRGKADLNKHAMLVEHRSAPLPEILAAMLKESDNHAAEQLRWTLLALYSLEVPLDRRFNAMLEDFAAHTGSTRFLLDLRDGSGLSRLDHISPFTMVRFLSYMAANPNFALFYQALPVAGVDGTLKNRMTDTPATGNAHAKTGTMRGVSSLVGYVDTQWGERLAFAVMINGYSQGSTEARKLQDGIVSYLAGLKQE